MTCFCYAAPKVKRKTTIYLEDDQLRAARVMAA